MKRMSQYLYKILFASKNWLFTIFASFASFLIPIQPLIIVTSLIALLDWWVKLYCIYKSQGIDSIKSNRMKDTFYKILLYFAVLFVFHTIDFLYVKPVLVDIINYLSFEVLAKFLAKFSLTSIVTAMILLRELKSIDENWQDAFGISYVLIITERFSWLLKSNKKDDTDITKNT